jgi:hypothetical protein
VDRCWYVVLSDFVHIIEEFQKCHIDHPIGKFFGECTDLKIKIDHCSREEMSFHYMGLGFYMVGDLYSIIPITRSSNFLAESSEAESKL